MKRPKAVGLSKEEREARYQTLEIHVQTELLPDSCRAHRIGTIPIVISNPLVPEWGERRGTDVNGHLQSLDAVG